MLDRVLIDTLTLKSRDFAIRWKDAIRDNPHLRHYNTMSDDELIEGDMPFYPMLARTLDRGLDRSLVGDFFVKLGKQRMRGGFPISEVLFAVSLIQKTVIEYIMAEYAPENPMRMYEGMGALTKVSEFCLMGSFYISKGFLEETYTRMSHNDQISEELLKKYFKDDFFFKQD
ncbi:MAG: hypothetical protein LBI06_04540 [Treponema sp.]|jgi:hypothetical protein|nr:hypothetical protein [Treponema sp.]